MSHSLLVVAATRAELPRGLGRDVAVRVVGMGTSWPRGRAPELPGAGPVIVVGACGALDDGLRPGQLVAPAAAASPDGRRLLADGELRAALVAAGAPAEPACDLVRVGRVVDTEDDRFELARRTGARLVDLETAAIAFACVAADRPWAALRWVSDTPSRPLDALHRLLGEWPDEEPGPGRVLRALLGRPSLLPDVVALGARNRSGRRRAEAVLRALETP